MNDATPDADADGQVLSTEQPASAKQAADALATRFCELNVDCGKCGTSDFRAVEDYRLRSGQTVCHYHIECVVCHETLVTEPGPAVIAAIEDGQL